ncbi:MAG: VWA domain-containing protein [Victivallales bacterium]|nr:VWA domain-containing protein [Victivallales bacterium]
MRRLPVYLLVDVSGSMHGEPIESVKNGLQMLVAALRKDPQALETAYLSVITFGSNAQQVIPLTELASFNMPEISAGGCTVLGEALKLVCKCRDNEVTKTTATQKGDWRPMVFILTDGVPTDDPTDGIAEFRARKWGASVCCAAGPGADKGLLDKITPECVVELATADQATLAAFFKWVTASIASTSKSINESGTSTESIDQLPPPPPEVQIV